MSVEAWFVIGVILITLWFLLKEYFAPDVTLFFAVTVLIATGMISISEAVSGFSNIGMLTVGILFVVVAAVQKTKIIEKLSASILGSNRQASILMLRLIGPIAGFSAFLNNTPIVAVFIPFVHHWCHRHNILPSKLLIPLSYAAITGGMCTLIGTSTTLLVNGMMIDKNINTLGFFEIGMVGLPCTLCITIFLVVFGNRLLPERQDLIDQFDEDYKEYITEMCIRKNCPLIGKTIGDA
ncbi:MAG: SLC13 family permease, partial [Elusimicrobia bacterium]|nr:SLC13 family permease [Elusimicrobiota bacterium]